MYINRTAMFVRQNLSDYCVSNMRGFLLILFVGSTVFSLSAADNGLTSCVRANEVLACVKACPPEKTCRNRGIRFNCLNDEKECTSKCICKEGFYRNPKGHCVTEKQCDSCLGEHEYYACGGACDNVCSQLHVQNQTNCPIVNVRCNDKCYCDEGYARDSDNKCIPIEQCPQSQGQQYRAAPEEQTCGPNEIFSPCKKSCPPDTCISLVARFKCDSSELCRPRCICKPGFLRLKTRAPCVPMQQCPEFENRI